MATINDLLYNYQEGNEFVCSDGRMSVNGICAVDQKDSVETSDITNTIIETSKNDRDEDIDRGEARAKKLQNDKLLDKIAEDGTPDYFPDLGKEKKKFKWDMDKPSKIESFTKTISDGINSYDTYVEENFGIPRGVQNVARLGVTAYNVAAGGGALAVLGPFALPALIGMGMNKKEKERIENITNQDSQGKNNPPIDMMTYDIPTYGNEGFNIHNDAKDKADNTPSGPQNQQESDYGYGSDYGFI